MTLSFKLTEEQQASKSFIDKFVTSPTQTEMNFTGYAGTGKSTLIDYIVKNIPSVFKLRKLIDPNYNIPTMYFSATTNKAADALSMIVGKEVKTIHSLMKLRVQQDYTNRTSKLVKAGGYAPIHDAVIWVDEISTANQELLNLIKERTEGCNVKIIRIGDPAQLIDFKSVNAPAFSQNVPTTGLTEIVRQGKGIISPITEISTMFREAVTSGQFRAFEPEGQHILYKTRTAFDKMLLEDMTDTAWNNSTSQYLGYTNKAVVAYNKMITRAARGVGDIVKGDYVICNSHVFQGSHTVSTEQTVLITNVKDEVRYGLKGKLCEINHEVSYFMPNDRAEKAKLLNKMHKSDISTYADITNTWIDLRAMYGCTVHKSQGSTFDRVYIDLDDISSARSHKARLLYVASSRPRSQIIYTGNA